MEKKQTHMKIGALTGLAIVIVSVILYVAGLGFNQWAQWVTYIPFIVGLIINAQAYAKANDHFVTYGNVWSSCFKASAIITLVVLAWSLISIFVFPDLQEKGMEMARERMASQQQLSDEQIDQAMEMTKKFFIPGMIGGVVFGYMIAGAILSLIAAAIPKKKGDGAPPAMLQ